MRSIRRALRRTTPSDLYDLVVIDNASSDGTADYLRRERAAAAPAFDELANRFVYAAYAPDAPLRSDFEAAARAFENFEPLVAA